MSSDTRKAEQEINQNIERASNTAQDEVTRLRAELEDLRRRAGPKIEEAENFLCSPPARGFYQGLIVGVMLVFGYAKWKGGLHFN